MRNWERYRNHLRNGDWQLHTDYTDGRSSIKEYFDEATNRGCRFLFFSEHVRKELSYDYLAFKEEVYRIGSTYNVDFAVGAEVKVLPDMSLDISDSILKEVDLLAFSYHSKYFNTKEAYLNSILHIIANYPVDIWAHPTSYENWLGFNVNREEYAMVFDRMKACNVLYEFNKRYPLPSLIQLQVVKETNLECAFSSDAHHSTELLVDHDRVFFEQLLREPMDY